MFSGIVTGDIQNLIESNNRLSKNTARQQSETAIQKQLVAFERLLKHAMSRFSKEALYSALSHVTQWAESREQKGKLRGQQNTVVFKLRSVNQLRELLNKMKSSPRPVTPEGTQVFKKCELFMNDLLYLKDLKKYFDDEIFRELMKYHFDASIGGTDQKKADDEDSGNGSQPDTDDITKTGDRILDPKRRKSRTVNDHEVHKSEVRYKNTIKGMNDILRKWEGLLSDYALDLNDFDPDSYHEMMQFNNYSQFEPILRMVPDIFAKCYKCIDLAKLWLKDSNVVMQPEPESVVEPPAEVENDQEAKEEPKEVQESQRKEFVRQVRNLESQIDNMDQSIADGELELIQLNREMSDLADREHRYSAVTSDVEKIDSDIGAVAGEYQKTKSEQYAIASRMRGVRKDSKDYAELKSHLKRLDSQVAEKHWKMKLLEFEKVTLQNDFLVELDVRPTFIRYEGATKEKIDNLERILESKKGEKTKLTKQLALLKTNTERMKNIMRSYLGNAETPGLPTQSLSRDTTMTSSTISLPDNLSEYAVDGNEADDDEESELNFDLTDRPASGDSDSNILKRPTLVKHGKSPLPERQNVDRRGVTKNAMRQSSQNSNTGFKGPKAALRSTPRRVWEDA